MKPKAGSPPHTSTVLDVPLAVSARVVWELTQEDTRRRVCGCVSQGKGDGPHMACRRLSDCTVGEPHMARHDVSNGRLPLTGCVLSPRYRWSQGMVVGAKESEGEARHTGVGVQRFGAADTSFVFWRIR